MESEAKKKFLMKVGIISVMALILIFWFLNMKNVFRSDTANTNDQSLAQLRNIKNDLDTTLNQVNKTLDTVSTATSTTASTSAAIVSNVTSSTTVGTPLINQLIKETNKIASSTPVKKNSNCPAYINCMPTIGAARACTIPVGCEGITQIAY